jgi:hypothetical protein
MLEEKEMPGSLDFRKERERAAESLPAKDLPNSRKTG